MAVDRRRSRIAGAALAMAAVLATGAGAGTLGAALAGPAGAAAIGGPTPFGVTASPAANGQSRPYFTLALDPGGSTTDSVIITNNGTATETLKVSPSTGITAPNSATAFDDSFHACVGTGCWLSGLPPTVTLAPGASQSITFGVTVPAGTPPKQYLAGITAEPQTAPHSVIVGRNGSASANAIIVNQVSVGVAVTVGSLADLTTGLQIPTVTGGAAGPVPRLLVHVHNTGQTFTKGQGAAVCTVNGTSHSFPVVSDTVLPADSAVLPINAKEVGLGATVPCTVRLTYGQGQVATWSGTITTPATAPATIIRTGKGTFSTLPNQGIPTWAVALIAIGVAILVALVILALWIRRRGTRPGPPAMNP